jgi:DNA-binding MarR family transcriptional regulator
MAQNDETRRPGRRRASAKGADAASESGADNGATGAADSGADTGDEAADGINLDLAELTGALGYALRRAQLAVFEDFTARFAALELTPAQFSVLLVIGLNPGRKQSEIARSLGIQRTNFVVMLDHLERRGLAERRRSAADGRSHAIVLTAAGTALLERARLLQVEQERALIEAVGEAEHAQLLDLLARVQLLRPSRPTP